MTARPGAVRAVLDVELPRPRALHVREHPRFVEYVGRIRDLIFTDQRKPEDAR
jgi:ABC-type nitrate/sulfonate/bicarbonate transport system ATPase subunit